MKRKRTSNTAPRDPIAWEATLPIRPSSPAWRSVVKAVYGTPLDDEELALFRTLSGLDSPPDGGADEFLAVVGRRGGKSETIARVAVFEAIHGGHQVALAPGQTALIPIISPLREQSQEILGFVRGLAKLKQVRRFVDGEPTRDGVRFTTGIEVRVTTADAVSVSGPTVVCAIRDEFAKFPDDSSAMPDRVIDDSLRPSLAPLAGAPRRRMIGITSAFIKSGVAYETDRNCFSKPDADVLVARGSTEQFNPSIDREWLAKQRKRVGRHVYEREYLAEWADAISEGWFGVEVVDKCVDVDVEFRDPEPGIKYVVAIDQAFAGDLFAVTVAHGEQRSGKLPLLVVDYVTAWKPPHKGALDVDRCVERVKGICDEYVVSTVLCDQHCYHPLEKLFGEAGIDLVQRAWSATGKAPTYREVRDAMVAGRVRLLDDRELVSEFKNIQGELLRSGGERIEAARGHDDLVSSTVMALHAAGENAGRARMDRVVREMSKNVPERQRAFTPGYEPLGEGQMFVDASGSRVVVGHPPNARSALGFLDGRRGGRETIGEKLRRCGF
jgi:hypothetical protein